MKKQVFISGLTIIMLTVFLFACGGGKKKAELSDKGKLLTAVTWKPDLNTNIKADTDNVDSNTGIEANIELKGDVKKLADFAAGTLRFGQDENDPEKLSYERTYGEGLLSTSVVGYWEFNEDESMLIMKEWDSQAGKEKEPVKYEIVELTDSKLVLKKEGATTPDTYVAK